MPLHLLIYLISCSTVSTFFHDLICLAARLIQKMALHNRRCQTDRRVEHHESSGRESLCFQESWFFCRPQAAHFVEDFKLTTPGAEWAAYPPNLWQVDLGVTYYQVSPCHSSKINVLTLSVFFGVQLSFKQFDWNINYHQQNNIRQQCVSILMYRCTHNIYIYIILCIYTYVCIHYFIYIDVAMGQNCALLILQLMCFLDLLGASKPSGAAVCCGVLRNWRAVWQGI